MRYEKRFEKEIPLETMSDEELAAVEKHFVKPFLLDGSPLFRVRVIKTPSQHVFLFDVYHVIADGISFAVLMDDIARCLREERIEKDDIYQFMQKEADFKKTKIYSRDVAYFKNRYDKDGWHTRPLPDYDATENRLDSVIGEFPFPADRVTDICQHYAVGKNEFYAVAAALAIAQYNEAQNVMLSWVWNGREDAAKQRAVGLFYKDFPIAFTIDGTTRLKDLFVQAKEQAIKSLEHGSLSYFDRPGLYQGHDVFCLLYQMNIYSLDGNSTIFKPPETIETDEFPDACGNSPELEILETGTEFSFILDYNAAEYKRESMEKFMQLFSSACKQLLATADNQ